MQLLMLIDLNKDPSPQDSFIVGAGPILPQASLVWKVWNLPDRFRSSTESVRRASGFVQVGIWETDRIAVSCGANWINPISSLTRRPVQTTMKTMLA